MTAGPGENEHRSDLVATSSRSHDRSRRVLADGGQAQVATEDEADDESDDDESDVEDETESQEPDDETGVGPDDESEADDDTAEDEPSEDEESEADDDTAEDEQTEDEESEADDDTAEDEQTEDEESEADDEYHVEDADDVYEGDEATGVVHLDLDGLFLDLLGLEVNLNEVTLDVSARPGENNLLGNLLSAVAGLLDGPRALLEKVTSLLSKPGEWIRGLAGRLKEKIKGLLGKPRQFLAGLVGGGEPEEMEGEPDEEGETEAEEPTDGGLGIGGWIRSKLSAAGGWIKEKLVGLLPGLPIEELVATVVRETLRALIDQVESEEPTEDEPTPQEAEA